MSRALKRRLALGVAIAALLAGGAVAATGATRSHSASLRARAAALRRQAGRDLGVAAGYLGVPVAQLRADERSGETLAEVAKTTAGRSEAGLIAALVAIRQAKLAAASARLPERVAAEVNRLPGGTARHALSRAVAGYLGLTPTQLRGKLRSGRTLAQVADATAGRSEAGLIQAIVAARSQQLAAALANGRLTKAAEAARLAGLTKRVTALVNRSRSAQG